MKKICFLLVLLLALVPGSVFSAPVPNLIGHWEGTGKFLVSDYPSEEVDVTVTLDITEQFGTKFKGVITARYLMPHLTDWAYVGGTIDIGVGGHIQGGKLPATQSRTINMFGGSQRSDGQTRSVMEIDGLYQPPSRGIGVRSAVELICHWRGVALWFPTDSIYNNGVPELGDVTLRKSALGPTD